MFAYSLDFFYLFSANQVTASYIRAHHLEDAALAAPEAVAGALGRPAYYPYYDMVSTFIPMSANQRKGQLEHVTNAQMIQRTEHFVSLNNAQRDVLVVIDNNGSAGAALQHYFLWRSPPVIVEDEQYALYLVPRGRWHASATK